jgi:hypothetical protein
MLSEAKHLSKALGTPLLQMVRDSSPATAGSE